MTNVDNVHPGIMNGWNRINRGLEDEKILFKRDDFWGEP